jgi:hypothetical protein
VGRGSQKGSEFCQRDSLVGAISFARPEPGPSRGVGCVITKRFRWSRPLLFHHPIDAMPSVRLGARIGVANANRQTPNAERQTPNADTPTRRHADTPTRPFAHSPIRPFAHSRRPTTPSELHPHRPQDLKRHFRINLVRAVVSADHRPVLLIGEIQDIHPQFDILPSIKDACI